MLFQVLMLEPLQEEILKLRDEVDILRLAGVKLAKVEKSLFM